MINSGITTYVWISVFPLFIIVWSVLDNLDKYTRITTRRDTVFSLIITSIAFLLISPSNFTDIKTWDSSFSNYVPFTQIISDYTRVSIYHEELRSNILKVTDLEKRKEILSTYNIKEDNWYYNNLVVLKE